jgi:hypothetical protein
VNASSVLSGNFYGELTSCCFGRQRRGLVITLHASECERWEARNLSLGIAGPGSQDRVLAVTRPQVSPTARARGSHRHRDGGGSLAWSRVSGQPARMCQWQGDAVTRDGQRRSCGPARFKLKVRPGHRDRRRAVTRKPESRTASLSHTVAVSQCSDSLTEAGHCDVL